MKKLINSPARVVPEFLQGLVRLHGGLALLEGEAAVVRADLQGLLARGEVAIVSGGGSGHEPAHAGFVGPGLLTAAVCGEVFASPGVDAILATLRAVAGPGGVLLVVKNYTGDRLNFGLAAELARQEGIAVRTVVVADDVALAEGTDTAGRRGLAGTLFVHKVAGAAAAAGGTLEEVAARAQAAADAVRTMGVGLAPCTPPAAGRPGFALGDEEVELGLGIHGEPGVRRVALQPADALVQVLLERIAGDLRLAGGARVALLVNGLGGTPAMELGIVARRALDLLAERGIRVERALCGSYLTALEMAGCSLSLLLLDDDRLALLDAAASSPAWPVALARPQERIASHAPATAALHAPLAQAAAGRSLPGLREAVVAVMQALQEAEPALTELDRVVGDGDLGISLALGAAAVQRELPSYPLASAAGTLRAMAATVRRAVGGTSGPLYAIGLLRAAQALDAAARPQEACPAAAWAEALAAAAAGIAEAGGARAGDRTMLDALLPAAQACRQALAQGLPAGAALAAAAEAAAAGADATAALRPRRGRSSYLGERALGHPDPGARAVALWLQAIRDACARVPEPLG